MTTFQTGRMFLSHNFDISEDIFPQLSREEFTQVFTEGLSAYTQIKCRQLNHPHWIVEIVFSSDYFSPSEIGSLCSKVLLEKRISQTTTDSYLPDILILGGVKTTPALNDSTDTLQTGEWGVDVVETESAEKFLVAIEWEEKTANKTINDVFKIEKRKG
ncbi:DUF2656 domain-containing protein [Aphanothece sacrum]|uniref:DUF2656 domain-containing protein n=1 Tax=Aphanothece sacrum FPU1 TaxID=1920663 RepID=A0A401IIC3_APHSA|nr:DUF2656 domain-containing protein [Aphanothece sacrum]GBF81047.1 hypothetical protein AsFPU1_2456 [Aphanothece sacrum FPU1]GBF85448.1 hypothetical protein AsFPU3_2507 [Aphanothece sacrum FPU3]